MFFVSGPIYSLKPGVSVEWSVSMSDLSCCKAVCNMVAYLHCQARVARDRRQRARGNGQQAKDNRQCTLGTSSALLPERKTVSRLVKRESVLSKSTRGSCSMPWIRVQHETTSDLIIVYKLLENAIYFAQGYCCVLYGGLTHVCIKSVSTCCQFPGVSDIA